MEQLLMELLSIYVLLGFLSWIGLAIWWIVR